MKLEAALITVNSPYAEVRAVVDNHDDENIPCGTIRAWAIGIWFVVILAFINQLFSIRQPAITVQANVAQLLAYPLGKACEKFLPDVGVTVWGIRHSLNPGPFSRKEQMLGRWNILLLPQRITLFDVFQSSHHNPPFRILFLS